MNSRHIAVLVDGGFFLKRLPSLVTPQRCDTPEKIVACLRHMCRNHVRALTGESKSWNRHVYRVFYYDALPYDGKAHHPIDNRAIDYSKSRVARQRHALFDCLKRQRKFALRLGKVNREHGWTLVPDISKKLLNGRDALQALDGQAAEASADGSIVVRFDPEQYRKLLNWREQWRQLGREAVTLGLRQKGVDMRIGIDIAALALKKQVDTIVLISGDSDFVPAAKLARREGMDFILDPLWQQVNADLFEHIDGLQSGLSRPGAPRNTEQNNAVDPIQEEQV